MASDELGWMSAVELAAAIRRRFSVGDRLRSIAPLALGPTAIFSI